MDTIFIHVGHDQEWQRKISACETDGNSFRDLQLSGQARFQITCRARLCKARTAEKFLLADRRHGQVRFAPTGVMTRLKVEMWSDIEKEKVGLCCCE